MSPEMSSETLRPRPTSRPRLTVAVASYMILVLTATTGSFELTRVSPLSCAEALKEAARSRKETARSTVEASLFIISQQKTGCKDNKSRLINQITAFAGGYNAEEAGMRYGTTQRMKQRSQSFVPSLLVRSRLFAPYVSNPIVK